MSKQETGVRRRPAPDRRISELDSLLRSLPAASLPSQLAGDALSTQQAHNNRLGRESLHLGVVVQAVPHYNWYKVQLGDGLGTIGCCAGAPDGLQLFGPRFLGMIPPLSTVLVCKPYGLGYGIIVCVLPQQRLTRGGSCPDWVFQGGRTGVYVEAGQRQTITGMLGHGGVLDFSCGRPVDQLSGDRGWISPLGVGLLLNNSQAALRVNEMCGLWLHYWDRHTRLAGDSLLVESAVHTEHGCNDEGEAAYQFAVAAFPWEAVGATTATTVWTRTVEGKEVVYQGQDAAVSPLYADQAPIERYQEYAGYNGHHRFMVWPRTDGDVRRLSGANADVGLFCESIGINGDYSLVFAKSGHIGKRCQIAAPTRRRANPDGLGDDRAAGNYDFSGATGTHRVPDLVADGHAAKIVALVDDVSRQLNWRGPHVFHYHREDFHVSEEGDTPFSDAAPASLSALQSQRLLPYPEPVRLNIDTRFGDVTYFLRESFLRFEDDGNVRLGCAYGAELTFYGGKLRLACPSDLELLAGGDLVALARQGVLRFERSADLTSATGDVRLKAERHLHMLGGNSGAGGVLVESRAAGATQDYRNLVGEDVVGAGLVLRARDGVLGLIGASMYLRTEDGNLTLDAAQNNILLHGNAVEHFVQDAVNIWVQPDDEEGAITHAHRLADEVYLDGWTRLNGVLQVCGDAAALDVNGNVRVRDSAQVGGTLSSRDGGLARTPTTVPNDVRRASAYAAQLVTTRRADAAAVTAGLTAWYAAGQLGNEQVLDDLAFSYRDDDAGQQYRTLDMDWPETRWQQLARLAGDGSVRSWQEPAVLYQGRRLLPWPGRRVWEEQTAMVRLASSSLYDAATGLAAARGTVYETDAGSDVERVALQDNFILTGN